MGKDPSEIRREIEETRARMGDTVEALSYKSDVPARARDAVNDRVETVKESLEGTADAATSTTQRIGSALGGARDAATSTLLAAASGARDAAGNVTDKVRDTVGSVGGAVRDNVPGREDVAALARRAGIATENPLGLILGALALGFLAGLVAPVTELERERVGPVRDELMERAGALGAGAFEHGRQVLEATAQTAVQTAKQAAVEHSQRVLSEGSDAGGMTGAVIEHGKQVIAETAQAVLQTAQQAVQEHAPQVLREASGSATRGGDIAPSPGMPADSEQGGGLRGGLKLEGGTGAHTPEDTGRTSRRYEDLLHGGGTTGTDAGTTNTLEPGAPGTASP